MRNSADARKTKDGSATAEKVGTRFGPTTEKKKAREAEQDLQILLTHIIFMTLMSALFIIINLIEIEVGKVGEIAHSSGYFNSNSS